MTAYRKFFPAMARCSLFSVTTAVLGLTWGCGGEIPPQATLDDAAKARVQQAEDNMRKAFEKKKAIEAAESKTRRKR